MPDGRVIIQTLRPTHPAIVFAKSGALPEFYQMELEQRQEFGYPPFVRLLRIVFRSKKKEQAVQASDEAAIFLRKILPEQAELLGPADCVLSMIAGNYRRQILLKAPRIGVLQKAVRHLTEAYKMPYAVYAEIDVDPISLL